MAAAEVDGAIRELVDRIAAFHDTLTSVGRLGIVNRSDSVGDPQAIAWAMVASGFVLPPRFSPDPSAPRLADTVAARLRLPGDAGRLLAAADEAG